MSAMDWLAFEGSEGPKSRTVALVGACLCRLFNLFMGFLDLLDWGQVGVDRWVDVDLGEFSRVGLHEDLLWCLAKFRNLCLKCKSLDWVIKCVEVCSALIGHWVEHVVIID